MLVYPKKNKIEHFELIKHDTQVFNENNFTDRWNLIFVGYTNCPDVCPNTLTDITNIYKKIKPELQKKFQIIFFSVDPKRDSPEHIGKYIDYFHDDLVGITGDKPEIDKLVASLGGIYSLNTEEGEYYSVDHTARIFIVSPKGERYGIVSSESMHNKDKSILINELESMAASKIL
jgi:protein SCO1/2